MSRPTVPLAIAATGGARRRAAFTILELLLVLCLLSAVSVVAIKSWFARSQVTLSNAAELLASDLRSAQTRATLRHVTVEFVFHRDGGGYHAVDDDDVEREQEQRARRYPIDAVFEDVRISSVQIEAERGLRFDALGRPNADAAITLAHGGARRTVFVHGDTARVIVAGED